MEAPKTSRAVRKRKLPARYQEGLTVTEISTYYGILIQRIHLLLLLLLLYYLRNDEGDV